MKKIFKCGARANGLKKNKSAVNDFIDIDPSIMPLIKEAAKKTYQKKTHQPVTAETDIFSGVSGDNIKDEDENESQNNNFLSEV